MTLSEFTTNSQLRNSWIEYPYINAYIRRSSRLLFDNRKDRNQKLTECLDIGSVEVEEKMRGKGTFKNFLHQFEMEAFKMERAVFIESILEPRLKIFLYEKGYLDVPGTVGWNMFKIV